jgi:hypothetical protein
MMKKDGEETVGIMKTTILFEGHMENKELRNKRKPFQFEF